MQMILQVWTQYIPINGARILKSKIHTSFTQSTRTTDIANVLVSAFSLFKVY